MLRDQKAAYDIWKTEFVVVPEVKQEEGATKKRIVDNPLSMQADSKWKQFYDDKNLWDEIEKDVKRTRQDVAFFHQAIDPTKNSEVERLMMQAQTQKRDLTRED